MRKSKKGKSVYLTVGFWLEKNGSIHLAAQDPDGIKNFHVAINADPKRRNGHPTLFNKLADCLRKMKAPSPKK